MTDLRPGHYWKTPFVWEPGVPFRPPRLGFEPCASDWLRAAVEQVMASSMDQSDAFAVRTLGAPQAAEELLRVDLDTFEVPHGCWRTALDAEGQRVGFVLPVIFRRAETRKGGCPEATIYYMGVLPAFRGRGYAGELLAEGVRCCRQLNAWRLFCDTGSDNTPMVLAFRRAGFAERQPWQRSVA